MVLLMLCFMFGPSHLVNLSLLFLFLDGALHEIGLLFFHNDNHFYCVCVYFALSLFCSSTLSLHVCFISTE